MEITKSITGKSTVVYVTTSDNDGDRSSSSHNLLKFPCVKYIAVYLIYIVMSPLGSMTYVSYSKDEKNKALKALVSCPRLYRKEAVGSQACPSPNIMYETMRCLDVRSLLR